jgi:hypothetical protein
LKIGRYFSIPESGDDLELLWRSGEVLNNSNLPFWLSAVRGPYIRRLVQRIPSNVSAGLPEAFIAEFQELQGAGLIIEPDTYDHHLWYIYIRNPIEDGWSIGIYSGTSPVVLNSPSDVLNPVLTRNDVTDVPALFVADPFLIRNDQGWYMFFEVMNARTRKGEIALAKSVNGRRWVYDRVVLREHFHMSYPYVFEWENDYYMVPETFEASAVRLYRASHFPTRWQFVGSLVSCPYIVDSSLLSFGSRWWLWAETSTTRRHNELRIYYAENLLGPWYSHPKNPIVATDATSARPAGRVITWSGRIIRYAQVCVPTYGTAVRAFEVTELTETTYCERECPEGWVLGPTGVGWNSNGMHHVDPHVDSDGVWTAAVDGRSR